MKRSKEVSIIVDALVENELIRSDEVNTAKCVVKEAIKEIRIIQYEERQAKRRK